MFEPVTNEMAAHWATTPIATNVDNVWMRVKDADGCREVLEGEPENVYVLEKEGPTTYRLTGRESGRGK